MTHRASELELDVPGPTIAAREWGLHFVSIDCPGHGASESRSEGTHYHFIDWVPVVFDVADTLGWETFSLLGHSMGAGIAALAAGTRPERIERTVWIDGLGPWSTAPDDAPEQLRDGLDQRSLLRDECPRRFESLDEAADVLADARKLEPEDVEPLLERGLEREDDGWRLTYDIALEGDSMMRLTESQVLAFLREIASPVRLIRPSNGWPVDEAMFETRTGAVDDLEIVRVEGPHHVHLSHPDRVGELVQTGLAPSGYR